MDKYRLTTSDNPYDPFKEWDLWLHYDISHGYSTCERIASIIHPAEALTDEINDRVIEDVMDEIIDLGAFDNKGNFVTYKKVLNPDWKETDNPNDN